MKILWCIFLSYIPLVHGSLFHDKVVYGIDNRQEAFLQSHSILITAAQATAAMIVDRNIVTNESLMEFKGKTLQQSKKVCTDEPFAKQQVVATCSGFLVAPDLLVSAGHCVNPVSCAVYSWVFDFSLDSLDQTHITLTTDKRYRCKEIIERVLEPERGDDYALIRLDRAVIDRDFLSIRKTGKIQQGAALAIVGHPSGLPTKVAEGGYVRRMYDKFFETNLDAFAGNSGSPVINLTSGEVEGILVRGESDYQRFPREKCYRAKVCEMEQCRGEDATFIGNIHYLKNI